MTTNSYSRIESSTDPTIYVEATTQPNFGVFRGNPGVTFSAQDTAATSIAGNETQGWVGNFISTGQFTFCSVNVDNNGISANGSNLRPFLATTPRHVVTKGYLDETMSFRTTSPTEPTDRKERDLWYNPTTGELNVFIKENA